jgi:tetratricopeptide (TPR) repeat protein
MGLVIFPEIPGYRIENVLGSGGMGTVFEAVQLGMDRAVALKVLKPELAQEPDWVKRFLRESRSFAALNHKNIVLAYAAGEANGHYYLAMEKVDGSSLFRRVKSKGRLDEKEAIRIAGEVAEALAYLNDKGLVHRDIKPENILMSSDGTPKLVDMGLAQPMRKDTSVTQPGTAMGTPNYISPEQIRGAPDLDIRCDLYGLGGVLYFMLTGTPPYTGSTPAVVFAKHLNDPIPDPRRVNPKVSDGLARIIAKCLAKDRRQRYQTPQHLLEDLRKPLSGPLPKKTNWLWPAAGVAVVMAGMVGFLMFPKSSRPAVTARTPMVPAPKAAETAPDPVPAEARALMDGKKWPEALKLLLRMKNASPDVERAVGECRAKIEERRGEAAALAKSAQNFIVAGRWAEASEAYTKWLSQFSEEFPEQVASVRDSMALADREMQAGAAVKEIEEAMAGGRWEAAKAALDQARQKFGSCVTLSRRAGEFEEKVALELAAGGAADALAKLVQEKKWPEAKAALQEVKSKFAATRTLRERAKELEAAIGKGSTAEADQDGASVLKSADEAFAAKKWAQARDAYSTAVSQFANVPAVQQRKGEIARRIGECENQVRLTAERSAVATLALANSYYRRGEFADALATYEKMGRDYADTKVYKEQKLEITRRIADCLVKGGPKER